jgi:hypothetical protein
MNTVLFTLIRYWLTHVIYSIKVLHIHQELYFHSILISLFHSILYYYRHMALLYL